MLIDLIKLQDETKNKPKGKALQSLTEASCGFCVERTIWNFFWILLYIRHNMLTGNVLLNNGCTERRFSIVRSGGGNSKRNMRGGRTACICVHVLFANVCMCVRYFQFFFPWAVGAQTLPAFLISQRWWSGMEDCHHYIMSSVSLIS